MPAPHSRHGQPRSFAAILPRSARLPWQASSPPASSVTSRLRPGWYGWRWPGTPCWHPRCDRPCAESLPVTGAVLVYVYRPPRWLPSCSAATCGLSAKRGATPPGDAESMLAQLSQQLCCEEDFPPRDRRFLGYPLADVIGFIQNRGKTLRPAATGRLHRPRRRPKSL